MPPAPGQSMEEYQALNTRRAKEKAAKDKAAKYDAPAKAGGKWDPSTTAEYLESEDLNKDEWFKEGEWRPSWAAVEFDSDACLKNVTKVGKTKDGFFAPAGTMLPLGAAIPHMTVLKYGGYFPAGTSFPGGVMVPLHARMVNLLPQMTVEGVTPGSAGSEGLCVVQ